MDLYYSTAPPSPALVLLGWNIFLLIDFFILRASCRLGKPFNANFSNTVWSVHVFGASFRMHYRRRVSVLYVFFSFPYSASLFIIATRAFCETINFIATHTSRLLWINVLRYFKLYILPRCSVHNCDRFSSRISRSTIKFSNKNHLEGEIYAIKLREKANHYKRK